MTRTLDAASCVLLTALGAVSDGCNQRRGRILMNVRKDRFFQMRVDERFLQRLDDLRRNEPDLPSRTEMARRLIEWVFELAEKSGDHLKSLEESRTAMLSEKLQQLFPKASRNSRNQIKRRSSHIDALRDGVK
jgi:hypothetical protein